MVRAAGANATNLLSLLRIPRSSDDGVSFAFMIGVDCWIGVDQLNDRRVVRLAGRLSVEQVPELLEACANALRVEITLTDLIHSDVAGIEALQGLRRRGVLLIGAPGYLQLKLDSPPAGSDPFPPPKRRRSR